MSRISNRFFVTALEDGSTLHGNLSVDGSASQAWNGTSAVPDWTVAAKQPTIYLTLLNGTTYVQPESNFQWLYNGVQITFDPTTGKSITPKANVFQKTTYTVGQKTMPALKIIGNLAFDENVDNDTITFNGNYSVGTNTPLSFSATTLIRITKIAAGGYVGMLSFLNGVADITEKNQQIKIYANLFGGNDGGAVDSFTTDWYVNDTKIPSAEYPNTHTQTITVDTKQYQGLVLDERDVVDNAIVRCEFSVNNVLKYTTYVNVDDMQDPEFMYIQFNGANANSASLRKDESVKFYIWVGKREDPTRDAAYTSFKVKFLDSNGDIIDGDISSFNTGADTADANGWRDLPVEGSGENVGKAYVTIPYLMANAFGKNITGILLAQTT